MTLLDFVRLSRAHLRLIVLCVLLGALLGFGYAKLQPTVYASSATGYIGSGSAGSVGEAFSGDALGAQRAGTYIALISSRAVAQRVVDDLGLAVPAESLVGVASGEVVAGSPLLRITATSSDPVQARDLADAFMEATAAEAVKLETGDRGGDPVVKLIPLENALVPGAPIAPNVLKFVAFGAAIGLVVAYVIALVRKSVDNRVRHVSDVEELTGSRSLGVIPRTQEIGRQRQKDSKRRKGQSDAAPGGELGIAAEAMRQLRTNLRYVDVDGETRTIVITSPNAGEGKSTIASNLARVLAASGQPTVLVDADLRRPMQARIFHIDQEVGLTQVLAGEVNLDEALVPTDRKLLKVLPAGRIPPNPSELLGSKRMAAVLKALSADHLVLIDAPPLLPVTDAGLLTAGTDGALLVLRVGKTFKEQVRMSSKVLERVSGRLLGTVMNMANPREMGSVMYGYGYRAYRTDYYYKSKNAQTAAEVPVSLIENDEAFEDGLLRERGNSARVSQDVGRPGREAADAGSDAMKGAATVPVAVEAPASASTPAASETPSVWVEAGRPEPAPVPDSLFREAAVGGDDSTHGRQDSAGTRETDQASVGAQTWFSDAGWNSQSQQGAAWPAAHADREVPQDSRIEWGQPDGSPWSRPGQGQDFQAAPPVQEYQVSGQEYQTPVQDRQFQGWGQGPAATYDPVDSIDDTATRMQPVVEPEPAAYDWTQPVSRAEGPRRAL